MLTLQTSCRSHIKRKQRKDKEDGDKEKDSEEDATTAPEDGAEA